MKKRTRRKFWNAGANPVAFALLGADPVPDKDFQTLRLRELLALNAFEAGNAGPQEWHDLNHMQKMSTSLAKVGIGPEALPLCDQVRKIMKQCGDSTANQVGLDTASIQAIRDLLKLHEAQRTQCSQADYERALHRSV